MIFRGCGCMCNCVSPSGRQCASGLSLLPSAVRFARSSFAHGVNGNPSLTAAPMLKNAPSGGALGSAAGGGGGGGGGAPSLPFPSLSLPLPAPPAGGPPLKFQV